MRGSALHDATEVLIDAGTLIPIDRSTGDHWKYDERDALPHDFVFNNTMPRSLPSGEFLDAVPSENLQQYH